MNNLGRQMRYVLAGLLATVSAFPAAPAEIRRDDGADGIDLILNRAFSMKATRGFATAVPPDTLCASACALTWLAGSPRFLDRTSKLGFHAAYRIVDGKASESGVGNVGAYLNQIGLPDNAVIYVTSAPPEGIEWLTADKATTVGISYEALRAGLFLRQTRAYLRPPRSAVPTVFVIVNLEDYLHFDIAVHRPEEQMRESFDGGAKILPDSYRRMEAPYGFSDS